MIDGSSWSGWAGAVNWNTYWLYLLTETALSLTPGPAVMLVIAYGLTDGAAPAALSNDGHGAVSGGHGTDRGGHRSRRALYAGLGILSANALYFAASATTLGAVLAASASFFRAVKWIGAVYLAYLGLSAIAGRPSLLTVSRRTARTASRWRIYRSGLALQLANPKTLIFFVAILPQFVDPALPVGAQMAWLAAGSVIPEFFILTGYGLLAARAAPVATDPRYARWTDRIAGSLVLLAAALVLTVT